MILIVFDNCMKNKEKHSMVIDGMPHALLWALHSKDKRVKGQEEWIGKRPSGCTVSQSLGSRYGILIRRNV